MDDTSLDFEDNLFEHHRIIADSKQSLIRIDKFLMDRLAGTSRTKIQVGISNGYVKVNDKQVKPNHRIHPGDIVTVSFKKPPRDTDVKPENTPINIVYEDEELLVVNKPAGMVVHPAHQNWTGTLVNALSWHFQNLPNMPGNEGRPGLVHRIDKDTSGLLVVAKTALASNFLANQFYNHTIIRTYWALVWGEPLLSEGTINVNVGRSPKDRRVTVTFPDGDHGRNAITHYKVLKSLRYVSLLECRLETGRTHQIRAHLKHLGHTLFNDSMYGGDKVLKGTIFSKYKQFVDNCFKIIPRQALHAKTLGFVHPTTKEFMNFESNLPDDFQGALNKWSRYVEH